MSNVDELRSQLKSLGYLSRGIERWFALDPWSSRTFWAELLLITTKAAVIAAPFVALPLITVMLLRNGPVPLYDALLLSLTYLVTGFAVGAAVVLIAAAILKIRPIIAIERPAAVLWASLAASAVVVAVILLWWVAFPAPPGPVELIVVAATLLLLLAIGTVAFSAALMSFSIHETRQIPSIHKRPLTVPLTAAGAALLAAVLMVVPTGRTEAFASDSQVVITPTTVRVALIAVDGLTREILVARPSIQRLFPHSRDFQPLSGSAPEVWASIGTGTSPELHRVRAVEAVRLAGSDRVLQSVSNIDVVLGDLAPAIGVVRLQPLPPTARERHYVWEILAARGVSSVAINWWTSSDEKEPNLRTVSQESVYAAATTRPAISPLELAAGIDQVAMERFADATRHANVRFATVYLPALDIILHRLELSEPVRVAWSVRVLEQIDATVAQVARDQWTVLLVGNDFIASTEPLTTPAAAVDVAPTVLHLFGFPASEEMTGKSLVKGPPQTRVRTFGSRRLRQDSAVDEDYYEKLRALGYIR